jgi:hypothetical protein
MPNTEQLFIAGTLIGELEWSADGNFPWAKGRFMPAPTFEQFLPYIDTQRTSDGLLKHSVNFDRLIDAGFKFSDMKLIDGDEITYIYVLDFYDDQTAFWRIGISPLDEDD